MNDVEKLHLIESFHNGSLSPAERKQLDDLCASDSEFAQELQDYAFLLDGFAGLEIDRFESQILQWESKHKPAQTSQKETPVVQLKASNRGAWFTWPRLSAVAASVALLLAVPFVYQQFQSSPDLVSEFLSVSDAPGGVRGGGDTVRLAEVQIAQKQLKDKGFKAFNAKDYSAAIGYFDQFTNTYHTEHEVVFFRGAAKLNLKDAAGAINDLEQAISPYKGGYSSEAEWLLALAQLQLGNQDACKQLLNTILIRPYHDFKDKAEALKKRLNS